MKQLVWLNGEIIPMSEARVGIEDRGFQFADGVYEVMRVYGGRVFTMTEHLERLGRSAAGIKLPVPPPTAELSRQIGRLIERSGLVEGMIYLQFTRGNAPRNHAFPTTAPTLLFYPVELPPVPAPGAAPGVTLHSVIDQRWQNCWIKSIALLPNVLAKNEALAAGADEAVFIDSGFVTECAASNFFAVVGGSLITAPVGPKVLPGVTRAVILHCAAAIELPVSERAISKSEATAADELFITSTTREISWVSRWDGRDVGRARACGAITRRLHEAVRQRVRLETSGG
jgi:D-alanine transaminase